MIGRGTKREPEKLEKFLRIVVSAPKIGDVKIKTAVKNTILYTGKRKQVISLLRLLKKVAKMRLNLVNLIKKKQFFLNSNTKTLQR